jgi:hypothetical protein
LGREKSLAPSISLKGAPTGVKRQRDEGGGRILLGDSAGGRAVVLLPIWFYFVAEWIPAGFPCI